MIRLFFILLLFWNAPAFAAVSGASLTTGGDATCNTGGTTASITPSANALVLACVITEIASGTAGTVTLAGNGLTWNEVGTVLVSGNLLRATLFRAMGAAPSAGAVTITASADQSNCTWAISEFTGVDTTGSGSGAVVQSVTNSAATVTALTVTLGAFAHASNATFGCFGTSVNSAMTVGSGFTELGTQMNCCGSRAMNEWKTANDTSVDITASSSLLVGVAAELRDATTVSTKKKIAPRSYSLLLDTLNYIFDFFSSPAHADFRNQMSLLANAGTSDATYVNVATQFGYEWVLGDPWSPAKAIAATNAGLKVMFNSNAERGGKWYNLENPGTKTSPANPTRVNLGNGYQTLTSTLWNEIKANTCLTTAGLSMTYPTIYNGSSWMFSTYSISDSAIIPMPNFYKASSITGNVDANLRILNNHQTTAGKQIYHGLYFDEIKFPTTFAPNCQNAGNTGAGTVAGFDAGRKTFIAEMKTAFAAALPGYGGTSGNANRADQYDPEQSDSTIFLDLIHSESSGGIACDTLTELIAGANTGCGTQNTTTFGSVDPTNVQAQIAPTNLGGAPHWFEASYQGANLIAGRAAWQSMWLGWFGSVKFLYGSTPIPAAIYVIRAVPNWDNRVSATSRNWNESTDTYTSSNSRIDPNIVYSRHWLLRNKLFVVRNSGTPTITLNAGENLVSAQCTDNFYQENANCTSHFSQGGTTVSFTGSAITGEGYVLYLQSAPTFQSATVSVADQLDVCFSGDGNAMLPATGSTGWTVTVAGVGKTPTSTSRQSNSCFRLVFAGSTITTGTQTVTVAYTPGNITSSTGTPAAAFTAQTAVNTLSGGSTSAVQTQTGSQLRHIEGDEIINASDMYGTENGNMFCRVGGKLRARLKIANTAAAASAMSFPLYYDHDDGSYAPVTTSCGTSDIIFTDAPAIPADTATTEQLASSHATNVACKIIEAPGQEPALTMAQNSETECEYAIQVCPGAPLGAMRLRVYKDNGSPLDAYTVSPRITVLAGHSERHGSSMSGGNF